MASAGQRRGVEVEQAGSTQKKDSLGRQRNNPDAGPAGGKELGVRKDARGRVAQGRPVGGAKIAHPVRS